MGIDYSKLTPLLAGAIQDITDVIDLSEATTRSHSLSIDAQGHVGIGTTGPSHLLHVNGVARSTQANWATSSDRRVKKNVAALSGSLSKLLKIRPVTFEYTEDYKDGNKALDGKRIGFIAQEVYEVYPQAVAVGGKDPKTDPWMMEGDSLLC